MSLLDPQPIVTIIQEMQKAPISTIADCTTSHFKSIIKDEEGLKWYDPETKVTEGGVFISNNLLDLNIKFQFRPYHYTFMEAMDLLKEKVEGRDVFYVGAKGARTELNIFNTIKDQRLEGLTLLQLVDGVYVKEGK
ncbi:hypothetical protein [Priestia megaterium]|uniref:hypothetical protein n=1 Tax=Priestia megaterium TaxID=1404 RepID=UPI0028772FEA|nr:hypothetical protein [Priestia megaterium]